MALVTGLVLTFIAAGTVCYVSATGSAAVQYVLAHRCADESGLVLTNHWRDNRGGFGESMPALRDAARRHGLDVVRRTRYATTGITVDGGRLDGRFGARDGAFEQVEPVAGGGTGGVWVDQDVAGRHGVRVGSVLTVDTPAGPTELPVTGVYPAFAEPLDPFWCSERDEVIPPVLDLYPKAPILLVSSEVMDELVAAGVRLESDRVQVTAGRSPASRAEAQRRAAAVGALYTEVDELAAGMGDVRPIVNDRAAYPAAIGQRAHHAVRDSLLPLTGVSLLAGLAAVVGLAAQWLQRRQAEVRLLWARGAPPVALGGKAVFELAVPLVAGCGLGWVAARFAIPPMAPAPQLDPWAPLLALVAAGGCVLAGLGVLAGAVAMLVRRQFQPQQPRATQAPVRRLAGRLRLLPWELGAAGLAVLCYRRLRDGAITVDPESLLPQVDVVALLFPLLCLAVVVGVVLRLAGWSVRAGHRLRGWRVPAVLWAIRRLAAQRRLAASLLAVAGLAVGVIAVGVGVSATEQAAVADKGRIFVGSDTSVRLAASTEPDAGAPAGLRGAATVVRAHDSRISGERDGRILVVDPDSFADGVHWRDEWAGTGLTALLDRLRPAGPDDSGDRIPALQVGVATPDEYLDTGLAAAGEIVAVARVDTFPGIGRKDGMLVLASESVDGHQLPGYTTYLWTSADPGTAARALTAGTIGFATVLTAAEANDGLPFLMVAWTYDFFVTLGLVLAAIAAGTLLISIEARRRSAAMAHALLGRMGLRTASAFGSHLAELAGLALAATVAGIAGGWLALRLSSAHLDPLPRLSPAPVAADLTTLTVTVAGLAGGTAVLVAAFAVRSAMRTPVRELLRG